MMWKILILMVVLTSCSGARTDQVAVDLITLKTSVVSYKMVSNELPPGNDGFQFLIERPASLRQEVRWQQISKKLPVDSWGNPYCFATGDGFPEGYGIYSRGPDGISRTQGNDDDDLNNWREDASQNLPEFAGHQILWGDRDSGDGVWPAVCGIPLGSVVLGGKKCCCLS